MVAETPRPISPMANLIPSEVQYLSWNSCIWAPPLAKSKPEVIFGYCRLRREEVRNGDGDGRETRDSTYPVNTDEVDSGGVIGEVLVVLV